MADAAGVPPTAGKTAGLPLVSILINNYNYGLFLKEAIDSALNQTYPKTEVIVVDDGSTDNSRKIIAAYGDKIIAVLKENGGQASAFNAGFRASRGDILCFLDSDDVFFPNKVEGVVDFFRNKKTTHNDIMVYNLLDIVKKDGTSTGFRKPNSINAYPPNRYNYACKYRYIPHDLAPTSGLSLSCSLARLIFPLPEKTCLSADAFLANAAGLIGEIYGINQTLSKYRLHEKNINRFFSPKPGVFVWKESLCDTKHIKTLDNYLNNKLLEHHKEPVISLLDSLYSISYYYHNNDPINLLKLPYRMMKWNIDKKIIYYSILSIYLAFRLMVKRIA